MKNLMTVSLMAMIVISILFSACDSGTASQEESDSPGSSSFSDTDFSSQQYSSSAAGSSSDVSGSSSEASAASSEEPSGSSLAPGSSSAAPGGSSDASGSSSEASDSSSVAPYVKVAGIEWNKGFDLAFTVGTVNRRYGIISPSNATNQSVLYQSSDEHVATVSADGTVVCYNPGTVMITAYAKENDQISVSYMIEVIPLPPPPPSSFEADPDPAQQGNDSKCQYYDKVVELVNIERENRGLSRLASDDDRLIAAANVRVNEITEVMDHYRPDGTRCFTAFKEFGIDYIGAAAHLASGYDFPEDVVAAWMGSPSHRSAILGDYTTIAIGYTMFGVRGYWVQLFIKE